MSKKVCLMSVANDWLPVLLPRLPKDVIVSSKQEWFDRAITTLRLEGPGLPEWCVEPPFGQTYAWGAGITGGDGILRIVPAGVTAQPKTQESEFERLRGKLFENLN